MHDDFGPSFVPLVEMLVSAGRLFQGKFMRDDHGGAHLAVMNEIHEAPIVGFDVALALPHFLGKISASMTYSFSFSSASSGSFKHATFVHVKIGAADIGGGEFNDHIGEFFD